MPDDHKRPQRYGVTRAQIARAQRLRREGDWLGACHACGIEVAIDPGIVAERADLADDLRHLVPDLLRWHALRLQRHPARTDWRLKWTAYGARAVTSLARYGEDALYLTGWPDRAPARFALRFGRPPDGHETTTLAGLRELWDDRQAGNLAARCGGGTSLPFFTADGRPGSGPASPVERVVRLFNDFRPDDAWRAAGVEPELTDRIRGWHDTLRPFDAPAAPQALAAARRTGADVVWAHAGEREYFWFDRLDTAAPRLSVVDSRWLRRHPAVELPLTELFWPADFVDLMAGRLGPRDLHPMVAAALFPALPGPEDCGPPPLPPPAPVRVACAEEWHVLEHRDGVLSAPHPPEYLEREAALLALRGPRPTGCAAALLFWRGVLARAPRELREVQELHRELLARVAAGEADTLEAMLDAGLDPHCRSAGSGTLLHLLPGLVPDEAALRLLPRLLAAGLDPDAEDRRGVTPRAAAGEPGANRALAAALRALPRPP
ncbi:hypothetical protein [Dactylosporangium salmoneum]